MNTIFKSKTARRCLALSLLVTALAVALLADPASGALMLGAAAAVPLNTEFRKNPGGSYPVKANAIIFTGTLVMVDPTQAVPATDDATGYCVGVAQNNVDNTGGADGAETVETARGWHKFPWAGAEAPVIGKIATAKDDSTLFATGEGNDLKVGRIEEIADGGDNIWVDVGNFATN